MKKRSLLAATAMLLIAVLAATGATYAWFSDIKEAKAQVEMGVSAGSSLEISADESVWSAYLDESSLTDLNGKTWTDLSTTDCGTFYSETRDTTNAAVITGYESATPVATTIYFRSTVAGDITVTGAFGTHDVKEALRTAIKDGNEVTILADGAQTINTAITGTAVDATAGTQTALDIAADNTVVKMTDNGDGYYKGSATFYFWVEGTHEDCINQNSGGRVAVDFTFAQVAQQG